MIENELVKKPYAKTKYTRDQVEHLKKCMDPSTGPEYFMTNFMMIQHPVKGRILFKPYGFQKDLMDLFHHNRNAIAMVARQMGKTTVAAGFLLHYAMFNADKTILIAAHKYDSASEIMTRVRFAYEHLPSFIKAGSVSYNKQSIEFDNGSRIIASTTTENTGRSYSLSLTYLDEFAFVDPPRVAEELWSALSPTLATGGKCIITSTPNTDEDQFAEIWHGACDVFDEHGNERPLGSNGFAAYKATWRAHPDRDEEWARQERSKIGEDKFRREHEVEFVTFEETLINPVKLLQLKGVDPIKREGGIRWYRKIKSHATYCVSLDPSMGSGHDNAAIQVVEIPSLVQVCEWRHNRTPVEGQVKVLRDILETINNQGEPEIYWSIEANTIGEAALYVVRDTGEEFFPGIFLNEPHKSSKSRRKGFFISNKTKLESCAKLKSLIESDRLTIYSKPLVTELKNYVARGNSFEGKIGTTDDLVAAMILSIRMLTVLSSWDDVVFECMNFSLSHYDDNEDDDVFANPLPILIG